MKNKEIIFLNNKSESKGITLVVLIITIIVMIILAAVAIGFTTDNEGVISQAQNAEISQSLATTKEKIFTQIEYSYKGYTAGKIDLNKTKLNIDNIKSDNTDIKSVKWTDETEKDEITIEFTNGEKICINSSGTRNIPASTTPPNPPSKFYFKLKDIDSAFLGFSEDEILRYDLNSMKKLVLENGDLANDSSKYELDDGMGLNLKTDSDIIILLNDLVNLANSGQEIDENLMASYLTMINGDEFYFIILRTRWKWNRC